LLRRALLDASPLSLRLLPQTAADLLEKRPPPRLAAHLRLVHDVACQIAGRAGGRYPGLGYDRDAMLSGAASRDIGKTIHLAELSAPGCEHEEAGRPLLLAPWHQPGTGALGRHARGLGQTRDHRGRPDGQRAGNAWKNKRVPGLEDLLVARLARASGRDAWEEFLALDGLLEATGDDADDRLAFQSSFPAHPDRLSNDPGRPRFPWP
jgi:hypothetical protein